MVSSNSFENVIKLSDYFDLSTSIDPCKRCSILRSYRLKLTQKKNIVLVGSLFDSIADIVQRVFDHNESDRELLESLLLLGCVLYDNGAAIAANSKKLESVFGKHGLLSDILAMDKAARVRIVSLQCFRNLCMGYQQNWKISISITKCCFDQALSQLQRGNISDFDSRDQILIWLASMQCLDNLVKGGYCILREDYRSFFGALKVHATCGVPGLSCQLPSMLSSGNSVASTLVLGSKPVYYNITRTDGPAECMTPNKSITKRRKARRSKKNRGMVVEKEKLLTTSTSDGRNNISPRKLDRSVVNGTICTSSGSNPSLSSDSEFQKGLSSSSRNSDSSEVESCDLRPTWKRETFCRPPATTFRTECRSNSSDYATTSSDEATRSTFHDEVRRKRLQTVQIMLRTLALNLFGNVARNRFDRRALNDFWFAFLPDTKGSIGNSKTGLSLTAHLLKEPNSKVRIAILKAICRMVCGARQFLILAKKSAKPLAFTPISALLANSIVELHNSLLLALTAEKYGQTLLQILKCLANIIYCCDYKNFEDGLLIRIHHHIRHQLVHTDSNVRVACLTCYSALFSRDGPRDQIVKILTSDIFGDVGGVPTSDVDYAASKLPFFNRIIDICSPIAKIKDKTVANALPVRLETMQVLLTVVEKHSSVVKSVKVLLTELAFESFCDSDPDIKMHAVKLLGACAGVEDQPSELEELCNDALTNKHFVKLFSLTTDDLMNKSAIYASMLNFSAVALENLIRLCFDNLIAEYQRLCFDLCCSYLNEQNEPRIMAAGCSLATMLLKFESTSMNFEFVQFVCSAVVFCFRYKFELALTNSVKTCSKLLIVCQRINLPECIKVLWEACLAFLKIRTLHHEKLKASVIGLICDLCLQNYENEKMLVEKSIDMLVSRRSTLPAVQIAVCKASARFVLDDVFIVCNEMVMDKLLSALVESLPVSRGFKVRLSAVQALAIIPSRPMTHNTDLMLTIVRNLFKALDISADCSASFDDYKVWEQLGYTAYATLIHFLPFLTSTELAQIQPSDLESSIKSIMYHAEKFKFRIFDVPNVVSENEESGLTDSEKQLVDFYALAEYLQDLSRHSNVSGCQEVANALFMFFIGEL